MCAFSQPKPVVQQMPVYTAPQVQATPPPPPAPPVPSAPVPYYDQGSSDTTMATRNAIDTKRVGRTALKIDLVNNAGSADTGLNTTN